ncbi:hypothetical protein [Pararhodospirillum oryzae]|uniref:Uncharacterized protein n=1 Tax=Pararhodospirillum oryzae TaxID=478448 RepID=A0A512H4P3_9PROT|nr:hypothetical protein [Pararhodospirillum oryzae]GEO80435.1 hypothetical protein ROR02_05660 [Pararhodospirillum oryzae]
MSDTLTRAVRAAQETPRASAAEVAATGTVNPDKGDTCARALVPPQRSLRLPRPRVPAAEAVWTEVARESDVVRVEASDGSGAWIDIARARRLTFRAENGQRMVLILDPAPAGTSAT